MTARADIALAADEAIAGAVLLAASALIFVGMEPGRAGLL